MTVKTGVYICHCGSNIAGIVDVVKLTEYAADLSSVVIARHQGQEIIKQ